MARQSGPLLNPKVATESMINILPMTVNRSCINCITSIKTIHIIKTSLSKNRASIASRGEEMKDLIVLNVKIMVYGYAYIYD